MKKETIIKELQTLEKSVNENSKQVEHLKEEQANIDVNIEELTKEVLGDSYISGDVETMKNNTANILSKLQSLSDNKKLFIGKFLYDKGVFTGCNDFGDYKSPTTCSGCHRSEKLLGDLGLLSYAKFFGDRVYGVPEETFKDALNNLRKEVSNEESQTLQKKIDKLNNETSFLSSEIKRSKKTLGIYNKLESNDLNYEKVEELMPGFIELIKNPGSANLSVFIKNIDAKPEQGVGVILTDISKSFSGAGCQYSVGAVVFRDGEVSFEEYVWRDAFSASKDKPWLSYEEAKIERITKDKVEIKLFKGEDSTVESFYLEEKPQQKINLEDKLDKNQQIEFQKLFEKKKTELIERHYRKEGIMPDYINFTFMQGSLPMGTGPTGKMISYEKPEVVEEYIQEAQGIGIVVIKAQIDYGAGRGKQYEWVAYNITPKSIDSCGRKCAYEFELRDGKRINMNAFDLYRNLVVEK